MLRLFLANNFFLIDLAIVPCAFSSCLIDKGPDPVVNHRWSGAHVWVGLSRNEGSSFSLLDHSHPHLVQSSTDKEICTFSFRIFVATVRNLLCMSNRWEYLFLQLNSIHGEYSLNILFHLLYCM